MERREFISGLGSAAAWPVVARAQQPAIPVIGLLQIGAPSSYLFSGLREGLKEAGYVEDQNLAVEYRFANDDPGRLPELAADLVRRRVVVIVAVGTAAALAAKAATSTIPIVFNTGGDPVALGLVASLNRRGANVTGSAILEGELQPKRLQLIRELLPNAAVFGVLADPAIPGIQSNVADLQAAARGLGVQLVVVNARTDGDLETGFATVSQQRVGSVLVVGSDFYHTRMEQLAALAACYADSAAAVFRCNAECAGRRASVRRDRRRRCAPAAKQDRRWLQETT
jgi:putative ABC transport system substrate-binding protein